jgi:hypothetical protein
MPFISLILKKAGMMLRTAMAAHRSQFKIVRGNADLEDAWRAGGRSAQEYFGSRLLKQVQENVYSRDWKYAASGMLTLIRYFPRASPISHSRNYLEL